MKKARPKFPVKIIFFEDHDEWIFENEGEIASNLEWFDSRNPAENAEVVDQLNRRVRVKVEKLELIELFLEDKTEQDIQ